MPPVDPRDSSQVGAALVAVAADRFAGPVALVGVASSLGDGMDSFIHTATLRGPNLPDPWQRPLVVRIAPTVDRNGQIHDEAAIQQWCASRGYPVPEILAVLDPDDGFDLPAQIMARASGSTMLDAVKARPWQVFTLVDRLAELQRRLHGLDIGGWPVSTDPMVLVEKRLALPRRAVAAGAGDELAGALEAAGRMAPIAVGGKPVVCHGDFHPLNVVMDATSSVVLDWTDAGLGPAEADVARTMVLFGAMSIVADNSFQRAVLARVGPRLARRYRRSYERSSMLSPRLDDRRMWAWEALHCVHGWAQILTLHAGGFGDATSADAASVPTELVDVLRRRVDRALRRLGSP